MIIPTTSSPSPTAVTTHSPISNRQRDWLNSLAGSLPVCYCLSPSLATAQPSAGGNKLKDYNAFHRSCYIPFPTKPKETLVTHGLPETAASVAVAATVVGAAATLLARRTKSVEIAEATPTRTCDDCGGSGICPECKGEGFVLKRMADGSAEKARLNAKNMATRYTAGLPKKWSYCMKCLSARSCKSCDGSGKLSY